jgi:hypothetical protein
MTHFRLGIVAVLLVTAVPLPGQRVEPFSTITFEGLEGRIPAGWTREFTGDGGLRMSPRDGTAFQLDIAVLRVAPRHPGDSTVRPMVFLRSLDLLKRQRAVFRELPGTRAIAAYDYGTSDTKSYFRHRAYELAAAGRGETLYVVTATASQRTELAGGLFMKQYIADADSIVLGLSMQKGRR